MSWKTWSPFQSPEVREICQNLTPDEERRLTEAASATGTQLGQRMLPLFMAVAAAGVGIFMALGFKVSVLKLAVFVVPLGLVLGPLMLVLPPFRAIRRRNIELLCSTEFARRKGYTPENLRLHAFGRSRESEPGNEVPRQFDRRTSQR